MYGVAYYRSISNNPSVGEFVWPGAWLTAGRRADGRTNGRPSHSRATILSYRKFVTTTSEDDKQLQLTRSYRLWSKLAKTKFAG